MPATKCYAGWKNAVFLIKIHWVHRLIQRHSIKHRYYMTFCLMSIFLTRWDLCNLPFFSNNAHNKKIPTMKLMTNGKLERSSRSWMSIKITIWLVLFTIIMIIITIIVIRSNFTQLITNATVINLLSKKILTNFAFCDFSVPFKNIIRIEEDALLENGCLSQQARV